MRYTILLSFHLLLLSTQHIVRCAQQYVYSINSQAVDEYQTISTCVRLLNSSTAIGCQIWPTSGILYLASNQVDIDLLRSAQELSGKRFTIVLPPGLLTRQLIEQLESMQNVVALLIPYLPANHSLSAFGLEFQQPANMSDDEKCPGCAVSPLTTANGNEKWRAEGQWNPFGRDLIDREYRLPMFAIQPTDLRTLQSLNGRLLDNKRVGYTQYPLNSAELTGLMYAAVDTETCLRRSATQTQYFCLPLGGFSVYSTPASQLSPQRPIVWLSSRLDSRSLFLDMSYGGSAFTSGLIVALAAADAISKGLSNQQQQMQADILFTFFNTEAWSFSGSQRFARDISQPFQCTEKCDSDECCNRPPRVSLDFQNIKLKNTLAFIELGQLGSLNSSLTAHSAMSATGDLDSLISLVQQALPSGSDIQLTRSSLAGQQLPPSSVQSFLTYNQSLAHIVLADHDQHYKNPYFNSPYDDGSRLNESALRGRLCDLSTAVAKSVYGMAMSGSVPNSGAIVPSAVQSNCSLIAELWQCLMQNFSCPLVAQTLGNPSFGGPLAKYTGFTTKNSVNYSPPDYIRFIHKWMADKFSQNSTDKTCQTNADCEKAAGICSNKRCVKSTTRFHESYGTGLEWDYNAGYFIVSNSSAPNWVQSNFDTTLLRLYKVDSPESQFIQLAFSILFAIGSILSVQQTAIHK